MKKINDNGYLINFVATKKKYSRRQDLPAVYSLNGAIYISKSNFFLKNKDFYSAKCLPHIMDEISSIDIDNLYDFKFAEFLIANV